ncbi:NAD(P)-binding protein [Peniophora sp. CONT]|nr:NAD(P)-binding protein [Peniophora sp. CONT]
MATSTFSLKSLANIKGAAERLKGLTDRHDIYPAIDPKAAFSSKSFSGKVVLITGASRGLGQVMATFYARAGAKLALVARSASNLDTLKKQIQKESDVDVLTFVVDVKDTQAAAKVVQDTVDHFGRIDIVIPNAGVATAPDGTLLGDRGIPLWWNTMEVNLLGTLNFVSPALQHLSKTNGYVIGLSSIAAQARLLSASDYGISKLALNRLIEFIALEYKQITAIAIHPGAVWTDMGKASFPKDFFPETPELAAATVLALTSGKYDWLSGRFVDSTLDLSELEQLKEQIISKDALVVKLAVV